MPFGLLANLVVVLHAAFLVFVGSGGLIVRRAPAIAWLHVPAIAWSAAMIGIGFECPLTAWEKRLRRSAGQEPYEGGFIDRYIENVIYPERLTPVLWGLALILTVVGYRPLVAALTARGARTAT